MRKIELGKTGLMVSEVAFGGIPIQRVSDDQSTKIIQRCIELGVNFLDTAHGYGTSEERIGRAIAGRSDGLILASKGPGRDAKTFRGQMELSFKRLGVEHIHLYHSIYHSEFLPHLSHNHLVALKQSKMYRFHFAQKLVLPLGHLSLNPIQSQNHPIFD